MRPAQSRFPFSRPLGLTAYGVDDDSACRGSLSRALRSVGGEKRLRCCRSGIHSSVSADQAGFALVHRGHFSECAGDSGKRYGGRRFTSYGSGRSAACGRRNDVSCSHPADRGADCITERPERAARCVAGPAVEDGPPLAVGLVVVRGRLNGRVGSKRKIELKRYRATPASGPAGPRYRSIRQSRARPSRGSPARRRSVRLGGRSPGRRSARCRCTS